MAKVKHKFRPGERFVVPVRQEHIDDSDPCNKENCMVNRGALSWFAEKYGDRKMKSTNHGIIFQLRGLVLSGWLKDSRRLIRPNGKIH